MKTFLFAPDSRKSGQKIVITEVRCLVYDGNSYTHRALTSQEMREIGQEKIFRVYENCKSFYDSVKTQLYGTKHPYPLTESQRMFFVLYDAKTKELNMYTGRSPKTNGQLKIIWGEITNLTIMNNGEWPHYYGDTSLIHGKLSSGFCNYRTDKKIWGDVTGKYGDTNAHVGDIAKFTSSEYKDADPAYVVTLNLPKEKIQRPTPKANKSNNFEHKNAATTHPKPENFTEHKMEYILWMLDDSFMPPQNILTFAFGIIIFIIRLVVVLVSELVNIIIRAIIKK